MTGGLLTEPDCKEGLSLVYANALAARAGYLVSTPYPDRDSVDLRIQAGGAFRPALDLQPKATAAIGELRDGCCRFQLSAKNYNDLRTETQTPRLLVVLELPEDKARWMTVTGEELMLRRRAYWLSLQRGHDELAEQRSVYRFVSLNGIYSMSRP